MTAREILNIQQAADFLGVARSYLYKLTMKRAIPYSKPNGKLIFFRREDLVNWAMSNPIATDDQCYDNAMKGKGVNVC